jgi:hypothetical protein
MNSPSTPGSGPYRIGAVAALSGLPANTIRTWERRYGVVEPERSEAGGRRYADADVERLIALRKLTERGHSISDLAQVETGALHAMLAKVEDVGGPIRIGVADVQLAAHLRKLDDHWRISPVLDVDGMTSFRGDALIVNLLDLGERPVEQAAAIRKERGVALFVVYDFAPRQTLEGLADAGAWTLRGPLRELTTLRRLLRLTSSRRPNPHTAPRRFDTRDLNRLVEITSAVGCECPQHIATLVQSLVAFEDYSRHCENKNPEDAALHAMLAEGTSVARQKMEVLLAAVVDAEGLSDQLK